jgi:hypothetical protein
MAGHAEPSAVGLGHEQVSNSDTAHYLHTAATQGSDGIGEGTLACYGDCWLKERRGGIGSINEDSVNSKACAGFQRTAAMLRQIKDRLQEQNRDLRRHLLNISVKEELFESAMEVHPRRNRKKIDKTAIQPANTP